MGVAFLRSRHLKHRNATPFSDEKHYICDMKKMIETMPRIELALIIIGVLFTRTSRETTRVLFLYILQTFQYPFPCRFYFYSESITHNLPFILIGDYHSSLQRMQTMQGY